MAFYARHFDDGPWFPVACIRRAISWRVVAWGVGLQLAFAIFVLRVPLGQTLFRALGAVVTKILGFSYVGSEFVFGEIGKQHSSSASSSRSRSFPPSSSSPPCSPSCTTWA